MKIMTELSKESYISISRYFHDIEFYFLSIKLDSRKKISNESLTHVENIDLA